MKNRQKQIILYLILCFIVHFIQAQITGYKKDDGIWLEQFADKDTLFQCSDDNTVYTIGKTFIFKYQYISPKSDTLHFMPVQNKNRWQLASADSILTACFIELNIPVKSEAEKYYHINHQTCIHYSYLTQQKTRLSTSGYTGVIENEKNIWIHPPREYLFKILELNPFPYIQFPVKTGKIWKWKLEIGDQWGDERWKIWDGSIINKYTYTITDTACSLPTLLGILTCCKVESKATSKLGKTFLTSYYNDTYGFVRLEYVNIDNSKIVVELINVE